MSVIGMDFLLGARMEKRHGMAAVFVHGKPCKDAEDWHKLRPGAVLKVDRATWSPHIAFADGLDPATVDWRPLAGLEVHPWHDMSPAQCQAFLDALLTQDVPFSLFVMRDETGPCAFVMRAKDGSVSWKS